MKYATFSLGLILFSGSLLAQAVAGPGGNYWPLFCKTGPNAKVEVDDTSNLRIFFESSGKAAGNNFAGVTPGTCSYPDRPPRKDELQGFARTTVSCKSSVTHLRRLSS